MLFEKCLVSQNALLAQPAAVIVQLMRDHQHAGSVLSEHIVELSASATDLVNGYAEFAGYWRKIW